MSARLHPGTLGALPHDVARFGHARAALQPGIVHLGTGAFARAHLAAVNGAALEATGDFRWGIVGVSLRHPDARDALAPQAGLYTLALRDTSAGGEPREALRVIGGWLGVLVAPEDPAAVLDRIADAATRIVSLTITEKGYREPVDGDLAAPDAPRSAVGFIVRGLQRRRARGLGPLTLMSLDNLPGNGAVLRERVLGLAEAVDRPLARWIAGACSFPNSMVDRIVPRTTQADRARIAERLGLADAAPVVAEPFLDWAVEDRFAAGRPAWEQGGARFVESAAPYERLKLRMVNGTHSALAYLGAVMGAATVDRAVAEPAMRDYLDALMRDEIAPTLRGALPELDLDAYRGRLLARYANPALQHRTQQIAMDGTQKIPQRWLATLGERLDGGQPVEGLALALAGWLHYLRGRDERGETYPIDDPQAAELARIEAACDGLSEAARVAAYAAHEPVFGRLGRDPRLLAAVTRQAERLREHGVRATLLLAAEP